MVLPAAGFGLDFRVEVLMCVYACVCVCAYMLVYFSGAMREWQ